MLAALLGLCISSFFWIPALYEKEFVQIERAISSFGFIQTRQLLSFSLERDIKIGLVHILLPLITLFTFNKRAKFFSRS
jgi:ABC-type spermidine/putrescine transport system permease subunit I